MKHLALHYRPQTLDEMIGQSHLVSKTSALRQLIEKDALLHTFFYGPAGSGKTTLSRIIAHTLQRTFYEMNATTLKIESLREVFKRHKNSLEKPIIFIDEIHRLSKNQQEVLLPFMEKQEALILGASTQNPYYSLTSALRSRAHIFELYPIEISTLKTYLNTILQKEKIAIEEEAAHYLCLSSGGDVRAMLNLLQSASTLASTITLKLLKEIRPTIQQAGSNEEESHYTLISALIKSIRGSDIDASLYYLARLIEGAEPPEFIARRLAILASEDIGNANPHALNLASSTLTIVKEIGYPEARITLSQLVVYLSSSPKSNSAYVAINSAIKAVQTETTQEVPDIFKHKHPDYLYPHDFGGWVAQSYLPQPQQFYTSKQIGFEKTLTEWIQKIKQKF